MATIKSISNTLYDELATVVGAELSVSDPDDHVGLYNRHTDSSYPYVGVERMGPVHIEEGIGNGEVTVGFVRDQNGIVTDVRKRKTRRLECDVTVLMNDDNASLADELYVAVDDHLAAIADDGATAFHTEAETFSLVDGGDDSRPSGGVRGRTLTIQIDYYRYRTKSIDAMESVNVDFHEEESGTEYPSSGTFG